MKKICYFQVFCKHKVCSFKDHSFIIQTNYLLLLLLLLFKIFKIISQIINYEFKIQIMTVKLVTYF